MHFLVMSPCSRDFFLMLLYIYSNIITMELDYHSSLTYEHLVFVNCLKDVNIWSM